MKQLEELRTGVWSQPFIPERLTPLPLTPSWTRLNGDERLRYNQLHGLYFHEQIIFFEQEMIVPTLRALQPHVSSPPLREAMNTFVAEENTHSVRFHRLLTSLRPDWYADSWRHFVRMSPASRRVFAWMVAHPRLFPLFLWLVQLLEERTMFASRLYLNEAERFPPAVVELQRQHLVDEADHVQWDAALLAQFWTGAAPWLRRINAQLLNWIVEEFIAFPRRAALAVIDGLAADFPQLSVPPLQLKKELRSLSQRPEIRRAVFGRDAVPRTWKQASLAPDLTVFVHAWLSHEHTL